MNNNQQHQDLLHRLENASVTCHDCGKRYGVYSVGCSSTWIGICGVCGERKGVTETRDYGYFATGRRKILKGEMV
jgi:hypothetical protein